MPCRVLDCPSWGIKTMAMASTIRRFLPPPIGVGKPCGDTLPAREMPPHFFVESVMEIVLIVCCISGYIISRPVVRALGIR